MFLGFGACAAALVLVSWGSGFVLFSCWVFVLSLRLWRLTCCFRACFVWGRFLFCSLLVFGFQGPDCLELVLRFFSLTWEGHISKLFTMLFALPRENSLPAETGIVCAQLLSLRM